jgi:hypothetical protein
MSSTMVNDRQQQLEEVYQQVFASDKNGIPNPAAAVFLEAAGLTEDDSPVHSSAQKPADLTDDELLGKAMAAKNGAKFQALWRGDISGYPSQSEADLALANDLSFWFGPDPDRIDRLFRKSGLYRAKWDEPRKDSTYGLETIAKALAGRTKFYGPDKNTANQPVPNSTNTASTPALKSVSCGRLTLHPENPHRSPSGRLSVSVNVLDQSGATVDCITLSNSANCRKEVAKHLESLGAGIDPQPALGRILADADSTLKRNMVTADRRETIAEIIAREVPKRFPLSFKTTRGAWSERLRTEITIVDFAKYTPPWLTDLCMQASDCPIYANGRVNRYSLFKLLSAEMSGLWHHLLDGLKTEADANTGPASAAAERFKRVLVEVLCDPTNFEVVKTALGTGGEVHAARTSLIERIRDQAEPYLSKKTALQKREYWRRVQKAFDVWWRPARIRGKIVIFIGLRHRVGFQMKKCLPGVVNQDTFQKQCSNSGLSLKLKKINDRLQDGTRLVVLSRKFVKELMAQPKQREPKKTQAKPPSAPPAGPPSAPPPTPRPVPPPTPQSP